MRLSEHDARPAYDEEFNMLLADLATFESTVKSFDVQARDIKRGLQVNQAINSLRSSSRLDSLARPDSERKHAAVTYKPGKSK